VCSCIIVSFNVFFRGIPDESTPLKYALGGKDETLVLLLSSDHQTLIDATVEVVEGKTKMNFTKFLQEEGEVNIVIGDNHFLWAYGSSNQLGYHAARGSYVLNPAMAGERVVADTLSYKGHWKVHGMLGFIAWGFLVPFAINASLLHAYLPTKGFRFKLLNY
jgi:hypothetical protein